MKYILVSVVALWVACYVTACKVNLKKEPPRWADMITLATIMLQYVIAVLLVMTILL